MKTLKNKGSELKLSHRQKRFCQEFILNPKNATKSYIAAGYSEKGAGQSAERLLRNADIQSYLQQLQAEVDQKYKITRERILKERARISFFNMRELYKQDGTLKSPNEWSEDVSAVISYVKIKDIFSGDGDDRIAIGRVVEVRTHSKDHSLTALEKIEGMYMKDNFQQHRPYENYSDEELDHAISELEAKAAQLSKSGSQMDSNNKLKTP